MPCPSTPVTRRELRLEERAARRRRALPSPSTIARRLGASGTVATFGRPLQLSAAAVAAVTVSAALLGGGSAQVYTYRLTAAHEAVIAADLAQERAHQLADERRLLARAENAERSDRAAGRRLDAQAAGYAGTRRTAALAAAHLAVAGAQTISASSATDVVAAAVLAPLEAATTSLVALIAATPVTVAVTTPTEATAEAPSDALTEAPALAVTDDAVAVAVAVAGTFEESLEVSAHMFAAATVVTELSTHVQGTAVALEAAAAAEQVAADELESKVEAALAAPNGELPVEALCAPAFAPEAQVRCDAVAGLEGLDAAFREEFGRHLSITSSYRTFAEQVSVKALRGGLAAAAGSSNHGLGIAVDFSGFGTVGEFNAPSYLWMREHAAEFGWVHPAIMEPGGAGPLEPWHWEFVLE